MARTRCCGCQFSAMYGYPYYFCTIKDQPVSVHGTCKATDEEFAQAAAQIAALQRERELECLPEKQRAMGREHAAEAFGGEVEAE